MTSSTATATGTDTATATGTGTATATGTDTATATGTGTGGSASGGGVGGFGGASSNGITTMTAASTTQGGGTLMLTSPAFENIADCSETNPAPCDVFPDQNISYMQEPNESPELQWTGVPPGTRSFAIALVDLTFGQPHWVVWNIPGNVTTLPANLPKDTANLETPAGSQQSNATFADGDGYYGPQAPCNVYQFELYALSLETFSSTADTYVAVVRSELQALGDAILGSATLRARTNYMMMCE
jgi:Raf kinase inhibitor-like YbhB/YbcL family protein